MSRFLHARSRAGSIRGNQLVAALSLLAGLLVSGCGSHVYQSAPVDASKARDTLKTVMDSWKGGDAIDSLQKRSPSIVVQDLDWSSGAKLLEYEVVGPGKEVNANLRAQVKLTLRNTEGAELQKTVTYVVGTSPALTVFRDMFE